MYYVMFDVTYTDAKCTSIGSLTVEALEGFVH